MVSIVTVRGRGGCVKILDGLNPRPRAVSYTHLDVHKRQGKYMAFSKRTCITVDFHLSAEEKELYDCLLYTPRCV